MSHWRQRFHSASAPASYWLFGRATDDLNFRGAEMGGRGASRKCNDAEKSLRAWLRHR